VGRTGQLADRRGGIFILEIILKTPFIITVIIILNTALLYSQETNKSGGNNSEISQEKNGAGEDEKETGETLKPPPSEKQPARSLFAIGGSILFFIDDSSMESDPMPVLGALYLGFAYPVLKKSQFSCRIFVSLDVYSTHYRWSDALSRPVPAATENRRVTVTGFPAGAGAEIRYDFSRKAAAFGNIGLSADCRIVTFAENLREDIEDMDALKTEKNKIAGYFGNGVNWLFFEISAGTELKLWEKTSLDIKARSFMPFKHIERQTNDSAFLGWRFGLGISIVNRL
jgi:hypothetical protein